MTLPCLENVRTFPPVKNALLEPDGLLCYGGDLSTQRLINAYQRGIFPWYSDDDPVLWWSPSNRTIIKTDALHVSRSLKKSIKRDNPHFYFNRNFNQVINTCATIERKDQGRWIQDEMITTYIELFKQGHAFSIEVEVNNKLVGGMYGVKTPFVYCGESMFSLKTNGSKFALIAITDYLACRGINWLDCQLYNPHLASMGAFEIPRDVFIGYLQGRK